jgi:hypothetical protein
MVLFTNTVLVSRSLYMAICQNQECKQEFEFILEKSEHEQLYSSTTRYYPTFTRYLRGLNGTSITIKSSM